MEDSDKMTVGNLPEEPAGQPLSVLILDDDDFDRRRLCRMSAASGLAMDVVSVPTISQMRTSLDTNVFDLIFLDYRLSNETGLDALAHIQEHDTNFAAAKIMLTGHLKLDIAVTALKSGCHDYVSKDELNPGMLRRTVETVLEKSRQEILSPAVPEELLDQALYDLAVTRLPDLVAQVLSSQAVQQVMAPILLSAIEDGLEQTLARYDLSKQVLNDPNLHGLMTAMVDDHQIRLND